MRGKITTIIFFMFMAAVSITTRVDTASAADVANYDIQVTYGQTEARSILSYVNELRTGDDAWYWDSDDTTKVVCSGLSELTYDYELEKIAMQRAAEIAVSYSHTRPNTEKCFEIYGDYSYTYSSAGENIAAGYKSAEKVFVGWEEADDTYSGQGHRRNMLNSTFNRIGIACVTYGGVKYWTMELACSSVVNSATDPVDTAETRTIEVSSDMIKDEDVQISTSSYELVVGDTADLPIVTKEITLVNAWPSQSCITLTDTGTWVSANGDILTASDGKVHAIASGETTMSATVYDQDFDVYVTIYTEPEFAWSEDGTSCSATYVCGDKEYDISCIVTGEITQVATISTPGEMTYTATCTYAGHDFTAQKSVEYELDSAGTDSGQTTHTEYTSEHTYVFNTTDDAEDDVYVSDNNVSISKVKGLRIKAKKGKKIVVGYKSVAGADGYRIQIARNKKFTKGKKTKLTKKTKCKIKKLKKGKIYYVRVQAYKVVDGVKKYGKWSVVKKIKVKR